MNRSRKDIVMLFAIGAMLLFAVFNFVFKPQSAQLSDARSDREAIEQSVSDAQLTLEAPTTTAPLAVAVAASAVPPDPEIATLLRQLNGIADDAGVTLAAISPTPLAANPHGPGGSLQVSITASGPHAAVMNYVERLRDLDRLAVVEQIGLDTQAATDLAPQADQLQLSVRVFTLSAPVSASGATPTTVP